MSKSKYSQNVIGLAGTIIVKEGKILLIYRNTSLSEQWETPGGKIERYESPLATAVRETYEEIGVKVHIKKYLGFNTFKEGETKFKYHWYSAELPEDAKPFNAEPKIHSSISFFSKADLISEFFNLSPNVKNLLKKIQDIGIL